MATLIDIYNNTINSLHHKDNCAYYIRKILMHINGINSDAEFYLRADENIADLRLFTSYFNRFLQGEPLEYILNECPFLAEKYYVDNRVLIPRVESEEVVLIAVKFAKEIFKNRPIEIADICSGSGVLSIAFSKLYPTQDIVMIDIDAKTLDVARINAKKNSITATFYQGDVLDPLINNQRKVDLILSNPPYILHENEIDQSVINYEKRHFLIDREPLYVYKKIFDNALKIKKNKLLIVMEIGYDTKELLRKMLIENYPNFSYIFLQDINKKDRILVVRIDE